MNLIRRISLTLTVYAPFLSQSQLAEPVQRSDVRLYVFSYPGTSGL